MALSTGSLASWADIQAIYTAMNAARTKFSIATVTVPGSPGAMKPDNVKALNDLVNAMSSNRYLSSVARTGITPPSSGALIYADPFTQISSTIEAMQDTCAFDSFRDFRDFRSFDFRGFDGFCDNRSFGFRSGDGGCTGFTYGGHRGF